MPANPNRRGAALRQAAVEALGGVEKRVTALEDTFATKSAQLLKQAPGAGKLEAVPGLVWSPVSHGSRRLSGRIAPSVRVY